MREEKTLLEAVLVFPVRKNNVLLGIKTEKIGQGCWNGLGGGIENGETPHVAAVREVLQEGPVTIRPEDLQKIAMATLHNTKSDRSTFVCHLHVFLIHRWEGEFVSTEEIIHPTWFKKDQLPLEQMMLADRFWVPRAINDEKIIVRASYGPFQQTLLGKVEIETVNDFYDE
jgi:8-oxo-dGTP pyrophosphatase MutT (NUDIX family)